MASTNLMNLLRIAAQMRAAGMSWKAVAAKVHRSHKTVCHWPRLFKKHWVPLHQQATLDLFEESSTEGLVVLRNNLRSKRESTQLKAAALLLKHFPYQKRAVNVWEPEGERDWEVECPDRAKFYRKVKEEMTAERQKEGKPPPTREEVLREVRLWAEDDRLKEEEDRPRPRMPDLGKSPLFSKLSSLLTGGLGAALVIGAFLLGQSRIAEPRGPSPSDRRESVVQGMQPGEPRAARDREDPLPVIWGGLGADKHDVFPRTVGPDVLFPAAAEVPDPLHCRKRLPSPQSPAMSRLSTLLLTVLVSGPLSAQTKSDPAPAERKVSVVNELGKKLEPTRKVLYKKVGERELRLHVFLPEGWKASDKRPCFVSIHGGGWVGGDARRMYPYADHFAKKGMVGISVEYRLLSAKDGTTVFDCVKDGRSAVRYVRGQAAELGVDPEKIIVSGGSAGGHVAAGTAIFEGVDEASDDTKVSSVPNALVLLYPVIDTSKATGYGQAKIGERWKELSPAHQVRPKLPPTIVFHGTGDTVTPFKGTQAFHDEMKKAGNTCELVVNEGGVHGYLTYDLKLYEETLQKAEEFLEKVGILPKALGYRLQLDVISDGYDGKTCWFHPRAGTIPGETPTVVLTMQKWDLKASDLFLPVQSQESKDLGKTWSPVAEHAEALGRRPEANGVVVGICDFTPKWHAASKTLFGTGQTVRYKDDKLIAVRPREAVWSVYDPAKKTWSKWEMLKLPDEPKWWNAGAGSTQRVDLENGDVLLPLYAKPRDAKAYFTTVARCRFDGKELKFSENGSEMSVNIDRGLYEPSLTRFKDKFYLTMRNDRAGYVAVSDDGLKFGEPRKWTYDDGADLGNYNTQQHWVAHSDGLFLVYTRRGAMNDHVMRHRAPLFMAQVDPEKLVVIRSTERELVPNKGAQLGNFAVVDVNENETWVTTSEGMAPKGSEKYGANGRVYAARLIWDKPNRAWDKH